LVCLKNPNLPRFPTFRASRETLLVPSPSASPLGSGSKAG
jgi:hypothetical protein